MSKPIKAITIPTDAEPKYIRDTCEDRLYIPQGAPGPAGPSGPVGPAGKAATISVGTVTTVPCGTNPKVVNSGTSSDAVLDFTLPTCKPFSGGGFGSTTPPATFTMAPGDKVIWLNNHIIGDDITNTVNTPEIKLKPNTNYHVDFNINAYSTKADTKVKIDFKANGIQIYQLNTLIGIPNYLQTFNWSGDLYLPGNAAEYVLTFEVSPGSDTFGKGECTCSVHVL